MIALPYLLLGGGLLLLYAIESKAKTPALRTATRGVAYAILFIFVGLRGHLYSDFINYMPYFEDVPSLDRIDGRILSHFSFEAGFTLYTSAVKSLWDNYFFWVAVGVVIDLGILHRTFRRYSASQILPLFFFIAFQGLFIEFNLYRNVKAIDCLLLSLPYLERRKAVAYMIINLLGATFHISALLYLPLYWVLHRKMAGWVRWIGIVFANIVFVLQIPVMANILGGIDALTIASVAERVGTHAAESRGGYLLSVGHIERTLSIVLFTLLYPKLIGQRRSNAIFYNLMWLYYLSFTLCYEVRVLADRIPTLFVMGYWVLYANSCTLRYRLRQVVATAAIVLVLTKLYLSNNVPPARYDNLLFGIESYHSRRATILRFLEREE